MKKFSTFKEVTGPKIEVTYNIALGTLPSFVNRNKFKPKYNRRKLHLVNGKLIYVREKTINMTFKENVTTPLVDYFNFWIGAANEQKSGLR